MRFFSATHLFPRSPFRLIRMAGAALAFGWGSFNCLEGMDPQTPPPGELIRLLGSEVFREREQATETLERLGVGARDAILGGLKSEDPEVVRRCRLILPMVESKEMETLIQKLSSPNFNPEELNVPGWTRFKEMMGSGAVERKLFVEICKADLPLLRDVERKPELGFDLIQAKCVLVQRNFQAPATSGVAQIAEGELAAILFCATNPKVRIPPASLHIINNLLYNNSVRVLLTGANDASPLRKLVSLWLSFPTDPSILVQNLYIASNLKLKESVDLAVRVLAPKDPKGLIGVNAHQKSVAIISVGTMGNKSHIPILQNFLGDDAIVTNFQFNKERGTTQVNDCALAMLVHLTGQSHKDYGFSFANNGRPGNFTPYGMGFSSPQVRKEAFDKWEKWAKANPDQMRAK